MGTAAFTDIGLEFHSPVAWSMSLDGGRQTENLAKPE